MTCSNHELPSILRGRSAAVNARFVGAIAIPVAHDWQISLAA